MSYEAGSKECRHLIEAKESLLSTLDALSNIQSTDLIQIQIKKITYSVLKITIISVELRRVSSNTEEFLIYL